MNHPVSLVPPVWSPPLLSICSLRELGSRVDDVRPELVVSICDPSSSVEEGIIARALSARRETQVIRLRFHDISDRVKGGETPGHHHLAELFTRLGRAPAPRRLLVHCHAGISRSPAIALATIGFLARRSRPADTALADEMVERMLEAAPICLPNAAIVSLADSMLGFEGRLSSSLARALSIRISAFDNVW